MRLVISHLFLPPAIGLVHGLLHTRRDLIGIEDTFPFTFRAARPAVCVKDRWERKKPSLSASKIATNETPVNPAPRVAD